MSERAALIVDDAPEQRVTLRWMLSSGFDVVDEAADGSAAIVAVRQRPYDVVVLDFSLPDVDGAAVARAIRECRPGASIAGFTASRDAVVEQSFVDAGVTTFFEKTQLGELVDWAARVRPS
jgi:CheY-like chemotaxis protein